MDALHPALVDRLLDQSRDPSDIPDIAVAESTGWLVPLASRLLGTLATNEPAADKRAFLAQGYVHLPLASDPARPALSVVMVIAGTTALEMYHDTADLITGAPQCARSFGTEQFFSVRPGTPCATQSSPDGIQALVSGPRRTGPVGLAGRRRVRRCPGAGSPRSRGRRDLYRGRATVVNGIMTWLDDVSSLASPSLREMQYRSRRLLNRLAEDRALLTFLVREIPHHPERLAASRVTLLLTRLSLYQAPDRSFETRLNMQPRPDNQLVPRDHCCTFATPILTGGYVHVVRRRTNGWDGPFTGDDLEPAVVTVERPGTAHTMVHQAVMEPDTVTMFVRGRRGKAASHAAKDLMRPRTRGQPRRSQVKRPPPRATLAEYEQMRDYLIRRRLLD